MKCKVYCYRDVQVGAFNAPFLKLEEPDVLKVVIARTVSMMKKEDIDKAHVRDLELYYLGEFDDQTASFVSRPEYLIRLSDYIKEESVDGKSDEQSIQGEQGQTA